jgi:Outer membrane lipoprotein-sorting protein
MKRAIQSLWLVLLFYSGLLLAQTAQTPTGTEIMQEVQRRHLLGASIYEEVTLILTDRFANRDTRNLRRYYRSDNTGNARLLLLFDTPAEVRGVALLASRAPDGATNLAVYLPASGKTEMQQIDPGPEGTLLGTDFTLEQMLGEQMTSWQYVLAGQIKIGNINHYILDVYAAGSNITTTRPVRRHYVRADSYYISRTDFMDNDGRLQKQRTLYDLRQTGPESWRAGMVIMENLAEHHSTLLKVNRTIFSDEYVPDEVFTREWLYHNQPPAVLADTLDEQVENPLIEPAISPELQQSIFGTGVR